MNRDLLIVTIFDLTTIAKYVVDSTSDTETIILLMKSTRYIISLTHDRHYHPHRHFKYSDFQKTLYLLRRGKHKSHLWSPKRRGLIACVSARMLNREAVCMCLLKFHELWITPISHDRLSFWTIDKGADVWRSWTKAECYIKCTILALHWSDS